MGLNKMIVRARDGRNVNSWHGLIGMGIYALNMATAITGFNALLPDASQWCVAVTVLTCFTAVGALIAVVLKPAWRKGGGNDASNGNGNGTGAGGNGNDNGYAATNSHSNSGSGGSGSGSGGNGTAPRFPGRGDRLTDPLVTSSGDEESVQAP